MNKVRSRAELAQKKQERLDSNVNAVKQVVEQRLDLRTAYWPNAKPTQKTVIFTEIEELQSLLKSLHKKAQYEITPIVKDQRELLKFDLAFYKAKIDPDTGTFIFRKPQTKRKAVAA